MADFDLTDSFAGVYVSYAQFLMNKYQEDIPLGIWQQAKSAGLLPKVCFLYEKYNRLCVQEKVKSLLVSGEMHPADNTSYEDACRHFDSQRNGQRYTVMVDGSDVTAHPVNALSL